MTILNQPWAQAILDQRQYDNKNHVPQSGRTYEVTRMQLVKLICWAHRYSEDVRFLGFDLVEVPDNKYLSDHFENGQRIPYVSDRNFHLRVPTSVS